MYTINSQSGAENSLRASWASSSRVRSKSVAIACRETDSALCTGWRGDMTMLTERHLGQRHQAIAFETLRSYI